MPVTRHSAAPSKALLGIAAEVEREVVLLGLIVGGVFYLRTHGAATDDDA